MDVTTLMAIVLSALGGALFSQAVKKNGKVPAMQTGLTAERDQIIRAYGDVLARSFNVLQPESKLPFSKDLIRRALASALLEKLDTKSRALLERGYLDLECFISPEEYDRGASFADKLINSEPLKKYWRPIRMREPQTELLYITSFANLKMFQSRWIFTTQFQNAWTKEWKTFDS